MRTWPCLLPLLAFGILGCGSQPSLERKAGAPNAEMAKATDAEQLQEPRKGVANDQPPPPNQVGQKPDQPAPPVVRKIIYTATLKLQVEDFPKAEEALLRLIDEYKGQLEQNDVTGMKGSSRHGTWKIRIAPDQLATFRKAVGKLGEAEQNSLTSQDVTEQYFDLLGRIKNQEAEVASYRELFKKATSEQGMKLFHVELFRAQKELEAYLGRKQYLENLTAMTTVTVILQERGVYTPEESPDFGTTVGRTWSSSLNALVQFGRSLALVVVALVPWLPVLLAITLPIYVFWRRSKRIPMGKLVDKPRQE